MGPKEVVTGTNNIVDAKLWGLDDNVTVFYGLRAYDNSGNYSDLDAAPKRTAVGLGAQHLESGAQWPGKRQRGHRLCRADEGGDVDRCADGEGRQWQSAGR